MTAMIAHIFHSKPSKAGSQRPPPSRHRRPSKGNQSSSSRSSVLRRSSPWSTAWGQTKPRAGPRCTRFLVKPPTTYGPKWFTSWKYSTVQRNLRITDGRICLRCSARSSWRPARSSWRPYPRSPIRVPFSILPCLPSPHQRQRSIGGCDGRKRSARHGGGW